MPWVSAWLMLVKSYSEVFRTNPPWNSRSHNPIQNYSTKSDVFNVLEPLVVPSCLNEVKKANSGICFLLFQDLWSLKMTTHDLGSQIITIHRNMPRIQLPGSPCMSMARNTGHGTSRCPSGGDWGWGGKGKGGNQWDSWGGGNVWNGGWESNGGGKGGGAGMGKAGKGTGERSWGMWQMI